MKKLFALVTTAFILLFWSSLAHAAAYPVAVGGTGTSSFSANSILTSGLTATSPLLATSTQPLYVGSLIGTTTATSTFQGGISAGVSAGGLRSANGITITGGNILSTSAATSTFAGGVHVTTAGGLSSTIGITLTGGSFLNTSTALSRFAGAVSFASSTPSAKFGLVLATSTVISGNAGSLTASSTGAATYNVNWDSGTVQRFVLTQNSTFIFNSTSSVPIDGGKYLLKICNGTTAYTATFPNGVSQRWIGITPATTTLSTSANTCTFLGLIYDDLYGIYQIASTTGPLK